MNPYTYSDTEVFRNKLGLRDQAALYRVERLVTTLRSPTAPSGQFDLAHLQAIHHHLFQDVYDWAGKVRTVEMAKGESRFRGSRFISRGMEEVHDYLQDLEFLRGLSRTDFAGRASYVISEINLIHPFPEGNGRTQVKYLEQLSAQAGHPFSSEFIDGERWNEAFRDAHNGYYQPLDQEVERILIASGPMPAVTRVVSDRFTNWFDKKEAAVAAQDATQGQSKVDHTSQGIAAKPVSPGRTSSR